MATRACGEPETFRRLVAAPCTADLRSEACARAVVRGVDLHGPACLDLAIAASTAAALPPYRAYVCPRAAGRLARLCGTEDPGALGGGAPGGDATLYKPAAIGLGVTTLGSLATTAAVERRRRRELFAHKLELGLAHSEKDQVNNDMKTDLVTLATAVPSGELGSIQLSETSAAHLAAQEGFKHPGIDHTYVIREP